MEPLEELPVDKWPILQEKLKALWPLNVPGYYALYVNLTYPEVRDSFQFKVYSPYGDLDNGFVSINVKPMGSQDCILFSVTDDTSKLEEALVNTKLIDWTSKVCIDLVTSLTLKSLSKIRSAISWRLFDVGLAKTYFLDSSSIPFALRCPPQTYVGCIKSDHLQHVDEVWPYRFHGSSDYFSILASNGLSFALYSNDELLAWIFLNEYNFLCHLYCEEKCRRKGLAEYLVKYVVNDQLGRGNDVYGYVVDGNEVSSALFKKLGFVAIDDSAYVFVEK